MAAQQGDLGPVAPSETGARVNAVAEWRSPLTAVAGASLAYASISGLAIYLLPFSVFSQFSVLIHTVAGLAMVVPLAWYCVRHWWVRRKGKLSHYQLLGYVSVALLVACVVSGFVVSWQGAIGPRMSYGWDLVHLVTGVAMAVFIVVHLVTLITRTVKNPDALAALRLGRRRFYRGTVLGCGLLLAVSAAGAMLYRTEPIFRAFEDDYNWRFGDDRPFAPSLARLDYSLDVSAPGSRGAIASRSLSGSAGCGTSGCHNEIYEEWLPSAHRYSAMDDMFQRVQTLMAQETSPEHTRYCAGCHDPISLFSGAKNTGSITLSAEGADEGSSCLVCHSIVQADVQGNADYTVRPPRRYLFELTDTPVAKFVSDFLIRTYPRQHLESYARSLYKTPEFCAACHKQYLDTEVNTDIGKVQGQNQYDSWKNSRWYHEGDPLRTVSCRECHMPLVASNDPARGDETDYNRSASDERHRSHRYLASNQYIPLLHDLPNAERHVELTEQWLRGEIEIPEIADKWTTGPVVRLEIVAPDAVAPGENVAIQVMLTNNKTGHDFPTGPLDMLESWIELTVTDDHGNVVLHLGGVGDDGRIVDPRVWYKADGFDRRGELIDRHNLWDLVGASYKRTLFPGATDSVDVVFQCPSMARGRARHADDKLPPGERAERFSFPAPGDGAGRLHVTAVLWYRKANPEFLDRVYGVDADVRSPATAISRTDASIVVLPHDQVGPTGQAPAQ